VIEWGIACSPITKVLIGGGGTSFTIESPHHLIHTFRCFFKPVQVLDPMGGKNKVQPHRMYLQICFSLCYFSLLSEWISLSHLVMCKTARKSCPAVMLHSSHSRTFHLEPSQSWFLDVSNQIDKQKNGTVAGNKRHTGDALPISLLWLERSHKEIGVLGSECLSLLTAVKEGEESRVRSVQRTGVGGEQTTTIP